jgi:hypothetical protein
MNQLPILGHITAFRGAGCSLKGFGALMVILNNMTSKAVVLRINSPLWLPGQGFQCLSQAIIFSSLNIAAVVSSYAGNG